MRKCSIDTEPVPMHFSTVSLEGLDLLTNLFSLPEHPDEVPLNDFSLVETPCKEISLLWLRLVSRPSQDSTALSSEALQVSPAQNQLF